MINPSRTLQVLRELGIEHSSPNRSSWVICKCILPGHKDEHPSAGFNLNTLVYNCHRCGSTNLYKVIQIYLNCSYPEAVAYYEGNDIQNNNPLQNLVFRNTKIDTTLSTPTLKNSDDYNLNILADFDPNSYPYTKLRGFSKYVCDMFNIKLCREGWIKTSKGKKLSLKDYIIIPIKDTSKNIQTFEARNLIRAENDYRPRIIYPPGSDINRTLFNIDNLDFNKDLYVSEGFGSIPKIYEHISINITHTFGSNLSIQQLDYLNKFKGKKIFLSDWDEASVKFFLDNRKTIQNAYVFSEKTEDTDEDFIEKLEKGHIEMSRFLYRILYSKQGDII